MSSQLSIIIPLYNENESLSQLYKGIIKNINELLNHKDIDDYELWFINDGSTDNSENTIKSLIELNEKVHLISFRKNFGKAKALQAGFHHATGDIIITMDADLQDDPNEIGNFVNKINEGYDLVSGWKFDRKDPLEKRLPSKLFNKVTSFASGIKLHDFNCGFKAYRREVVESLDVYGEFHRYIPVLASRNGFKITEIKVLHHKREYGKSKYGVERYLRGLFDSLTTSFLLRFSDRPMFFFGKAGLIMFFASFISAVLTVVGWIINLNFLKWVILVICIMFLIAAIQFFLCGFLANLLVDATYHQKYSEHHIKEII